MVVHQPEREDLSQVAAQAAWVRRLAVALAQDVHAGEDVAQDALLAAAREHGRGMGNLRAWLTGAVRNLARLRRRTDDRRTARERLSARPERCDDPLIAFERLELQEALLGAVRELPEPYRTTVLLRWFEALEPEEIARRTSTPVRTVHTRLHRALALLREALDRRSRGDRSRWLAAWLPFIPNSSPAWKWVLLMDLKAKLAIAGLAAVAVTTVWVVSSPAPRPEERRELALARGPADAIAPASKALDSAASGAEHREPAAELGGSKRASAKAVVTRPLHGLVMDVTGAKLPGIEVVFHSGDSTHGAPSARGTSDGLGRFELEVDAQRGTLEHASGDWAVVYKPEITVPDPSDGYVLVLGRPRVIEGFVRDPSDEPIAGAEVWFGPSGSPRLSSSLDPFDGWMWFGDPLRLSLGVNLDSSRLQDQNWSTRSSSNGSFSIRGVDSIRRFRIRASAPGYDPAEVALPDGKQAVVVVLHKRSDVRSGELYGRVVDPDGKGISSACLRLGSQRADSDKRGEFVIRIDTQNPGARLIALHRDWRPVLQPCLSASPSDPGAWPDPLVLTMTQPQPGIAGVVVDPEGKPVPGVDVFTLDPLSWNQMLGTLGEAPIEGGDETDRVLGDAAVTTDKDGRFHLNAVAGRSCRLLVRSKRTLEITISAPIPAGTTDATIIFGEACGRCLFAGRIVDLHGNPIAGASIAAMRTVSGSGPHASMRLDTDGVPTDATGRFEMPDKSCDLEGFIVWPDPGAPANIVPIDRSAARDALLIRVGRIARVQVELHTPGLVADSITFFDASGTQRQVGVKTKGGWAGGDSWGIGDGRTEVLIVSEEAKTLVLKLHGEEVARVAIDLDPATVTLVQP
jgi:RNA polymerase sigma-70 factor (ECF subfamily)